jgi:hypothetical protein
MNEFLIYNDHQAHLFLDPLELIFSVYNQYLLIHLLIKILIAYYVSSNALYSPRIVQMGNQCFYKSRHHLAWISLKSGYKSLEIC